MVGKMAAFARRPFAEVPLSAARIRLSLAGKALAAAPEKAKRPRLRSLQPGAKILRGTTLFLPGAASRRGPCRLRQRRCLQPDAVTGVPDAGLGQPPLAGATLRPCSASCSPPVSTIGALWLRQCQKPTLLFLVFVWFFVYVHHYSVAAPLCQWGRSAKSSRHFAARQGKIHKAFWIKGFFSPRRLPAHLEKAAARSFRPS